MPSTAAAKRYARALFSLAQDAGSVPDTRRELGAYAELVAEHADVRAALFQPLYPAAQRKAALLAVAERLGTSDLLRTFLQFLIDQRRLVDFPAITAEFERLADEASGKLRAEVIAASPLPEAQGERLRRALSEHSGREVSLTTSVDESLLGGVVAKVGDLVFDGSLRTQLRQLRASLTKEV